MKPEPTKRPPKPLDQEALERLALFYVGRYGTTRAKLRTYLGRKVRERGWQGEQAVDVDQLVERLAGLGYVDDAAFATARAASLQRRGFGERRVAQSLKAAGIEAKDCESATEQARAGAVRSAMRFAERKRIGPFAQDPGDRASRQKAFAAMMRAGHPSDIIRKVLDAGADEAREWDEA